MTLDNIREFGEVYQGSEEEREDVKAAYLENEGDMDGIMTVVCELRS